MGTKERNANEDRFPVRKNPRIRGYDYATPNYYFITICTHEKKCLFWSNGKLNQFGRIAYDAVMQIPVHFPRNRVDKFVIMPNHIHMILVVEPGGKDTSVVVGSFKSHVSRLIHQLCPERKLWQVSYHDHGIRSQKEYEHIWMYIDTNPIRWEKDCFYTKSSACACLGRAENQTGRRGRALALQKRVLKD